MFKYSYAQKYHMINKNISISNNSKLSEKEIYGAYRIFFGTLVSEPRLRIINLLRKREKNVSEIMSELGMDQTSVSHNLSRLKKCGFVASKIEGKYRQYSLNKKTIKPLMNLIDKHMSGHCVHILQNKKEGTR